MALRPEGLYPHHDGRSSHYRGDPYTYLEAARQMTSFYAAHWREPVFPYATRAWLRLLNGQDVAVSFASTGFSLLAIWLTYILGAALWSRPVGLAAALGFSLDADVVAYASYGFRDDAYVALVVCCAWLMVRCWRTLREPPRARHVGRLRIDAAHIEAVALGVAAGLAVLTRIMAVPFLFAGGVFLLLAPRPPWRRRASMVAVVTLTATVVVAPYFVNCWRVYGDPLYTFNIHGSVYGAAEGQGERTGSTASYVGEKIARRPAQSLDTVAQGLTTYPFANKWRGLDHWHAGLGRWASLAALGGLMVLAAMSPGRLLLVAFVGALLPFSFTWKVDPDFRFTEFLYPFLLVAAATALAAAARGGRTILVGGTVAGPRAARDISWRWAGVAAGLAVVALWFVTHVSPAWVFGESVRSGESTLDHGRFPGRSVLRWPVVGHGARGRRRHARGALDQFHLGLPAQRRRVPGHAADGPVSETARARTQAAAGRGTAPERRSTGRADAHLEPATNGNVRRRVAARAGAPRRKPAGTARAAAR